MIFETLVVNNFAVNCYVVGCPDTREAMVVDPGGNPDGILGSLEGNGLRAVCIVNTHGHIDHIMANRQVKERTGAPLRIHQDDAEMLERSGEQSMAMLGMEITSPGADSFLEDGEVFRVGNIEVEVLHTPGHSPGGVCLKMGDKLITGDTLFAQSIGRTDIRGGDMRTLMRSLKEKVMTLDDDTEIYPGHGPASKIGMEKKWNPFVNGMAQFTDL
jgi:glyoxylase-like metal-dependent hydrolase (beta-lactamase superfamily II)